MKKCKAKTQQAIPTYAEKFFGVTLPRYPAQAITGTPKISRKELRKAQRDLNKFLDSQFS